MAAAKRQNQISTGIQLRKELYKQVEGRVRALMGHEPQSLVAYRKAYDKEFTKSWRASHRTELLNAISVSKVIFLGDFHALHQSQKAQLRILKALSDKKPTLLALECFEARHQSLLNQFLKGDLSEKDFLKAIRWHENWGFPWDHYKPLLRWAQKKKIAVLALNKKTSSLKERDQFSAQIISTAIKENKDHRVIVIYGDLHLAQEHLPAQILKKTTRLLSRKDFAFVYQNSEKIYFQLLKQGLDLNIDVVRLAEKSFCLMSVPPWVKWQNYLLYLEQQFDQEIDSELDYTDYISSFVKILSKDLQAETSTDSLAIYSAQDDALWEKIEQMQSLESRRWFEKMIENSVSFYLPDLAYGYLARPSVNHASSLAMAFVYSRLSGWRRWPELMPEDLIRLIWLEAICYFGSKLINPKRKTDTVADIKQSLAQGVSDALLREALRLALAQKMHEILKISNMGRSQSLPRPRNKSVYREVARILGGILGEKLFYAFRKKMISKNTLISLLRKNIDNENFEQTYYELLEIVDSFPEPFRSKTEKL